MIQVADLVKYHGNNRVLDKVTLNVRRGEVAVIVGPSGGGKSTLLRCINGLEVFQEGKVVCDGLALDPHNGIPAQDRDLTQLRQRVGMVFQQFHLFPHLTVLANVMSGPRVVKKIPAEPAEWKARQLLDRVGLLDKAGARPHELSGGQQQRVAIARALAMEPLALLFDEPTSALDPRMADEVLKVITELASSGQTMIVVTHAMNFARNIAQTLHVMHAGRIVESGPPAVLFNQPREPATRSFLRGTLDS